MVRVCDRRIVQLRDGASRWYGFKLVPVAVVPVAFGVEEKEVVAACEVGVEHGLRVMSSHLGGEHRVRKVENTDWRPVHPDILIARVD